MLMKKSQRVLKMGGKGRMLKVDATHPIQAISSTKRKTASELLFLHTH
jgi:hypothetical protein